MGAVRVAGTKASVTSAANVDLKALEVDDMGQVAITYKVNLNGVDADVDGISTSAKGLSSGTYDVQSVEIKPLAFGLKYVQVHVVMDDGEGLVDGFEDGLRGIDGVTDLEILEMGLL